LPFLAQISKGRLNVSEVSILPPRGSEISAQGQVFVPVHEHPSEWDSAAIRSYSEKEDQGIDPATESPAQPHQSDEAASAISTTPNNDLGSLEQSATPATEVNSAADQAEAGPSESGAAGIITNHFSKSDSALDQISSTSKRPAPLYSASIPEIRIHRPSGTIMAASLGTSALNSASVPGTPGPTAALPTPGAGSGPLGAIPDATAALPIPANLPIDPSTVTNAAPGAVPGQPLGGKGGKRGIRKKVVGKTRKMVVRKPVLAVILGRDVANLVHPLLQQATSGVAAAPLPVDGPSDFVSKSWLRDERRRDLRRQRLDHKITAAKLQADAEELDQCPICGGLRRTRYHQRYHRLVLKRDRPQIRMVDRVATSMARVAAAGCKCSKGVTGTRRADSASDQHVARSQFLEVPGGGHGHWGRGDREMGR
jgi:hypothetical protein